MVSSSPSRPSSLHDPRYPHYAVPPLSSNGMSSFGDLHDTGASGIMFTTTPLSSRRQFEYDTPDNRHSINANNEYLEVRGEVPSSDLHNINTLHVLIGAIAGILLAVAVTQVGDDDVRESAFTKWMLLPGELYANAMLCVVLPTIFLNSVLGSMHFSTLNKHKALGSKMVVLFLVTTLWASVLGALVALCFTPMFPANQGLRILSTDASGLRADTASVAFTCPQSTKNQSLLVQADGSMRCTQPLEAVNGTMFTLEDLAHTFRIRAASSHDGTAAAIIPSLAEQVMLLLETLFPMNLLQCFLEGDVLSVIIIGAAFGMALLHFSSISSVAGTSESSLLFLLIMQGEVILSVLLRFLLRVLPGAMVFMVCGTLLQSPRGADTSQLTPSTQDLASFFGVLLFALVLNFASVLSVAMVMTKSNPLLYIHQMIPAQLVALGTASSLIALPTTVRSIAASKQVSMPLAHFVCSTGTVLNKNGSAIYLSVASVYIISVAGLPGHELDASSVMLLMLASMLCSFVLPPMSHGGAVVVGTILSSIFQIDAGAASILVSFLAGMNWICDPFVTALNVTNDALIAWILAHQMDERFLDQSFDTQEEETDDGLGETGRRPNPMRAPHSLIHQQSSIGESEVFI